MIIAFKSTIHRELILVFRRGSDLCLTVIFFLLVAILFPLALGPDQRLLAQIGPGVIWVSALLSSMLTIDRLFNADFEDGSLEQLATFSSPLYYNRICKAFCSLVNFRITHSIFFARDWYLLRYSSVFLPCPYFKYCTRNTSAQHDRRRECCAFFRGQAKGRFITVIGAPTSYPCFDIRDCSRQCRHLGHPSGPVSTSVGWRIDGDPGCCTLNYQHHNQTGP